MAIVETHPAFRLAEKHFKNRSTAALPALRGLPSSLCLPLLDLARPAEEDDDSVWRAGWWSNVYTSEVPKPGKSRKRRNSRAVSNEPARGDRPELELDGMKRVFLADGKEGFLVAEGCVLVPGYLDVEQQKAFLLAALAEYTLSPNPKSLDTHYSLPPSLFHAYSTTPDLLISPKHLTLDESERNARSQAAEVNKGPRTLIETAPASKLGYDEVKRRNATWTGDDMSLKLNSKTAEALMKELRWANLGRVYQWSTKTYDFTARGNIAFPQDLEDVCRRIVSDTPWGEVYANVQEDAVPKFSTWPEDYKPDTGIVNYYQKNDTLMAHVDRSELDPARPLVSISLGHSAIFLLGTDSREDPPRPLILRSGDVLIMSGRGRQAYHGVPRIMEGTHAPHFLEADDDSIEMRAAKRWVANARININARQVFPPGFTVNDA
ncbi:Alpha-ketoglutarate-dependent dioxygenase abh1 [Vanrija pseudolonga]|uniref:Alpha-ketoglutarate-dependent dioxygenase abh1 n=1 Tax=Vanrija pseudolonga TaxID=143232 RepID=A0AAF0YKC4_9TREE|nr:Alpha-ketoglutarate-dependent dioxygenase abh1 [Vanrija pseudolonga]